MKAMRLTAPRSPLRLEDIEPAQPRPGQVLIKVQACGVCRTDLHLVDGELPQCRLPVTPGHEIDHVSYYLGEERILFTGDCILGASSTTVRDLASYMRSLELLTSYPHETICPGHGPVVPPPRGAEWVRWYIDHRQQREQQVIAALGKGLGTVEAITREVYPSDLPAGLRRGAEQNVATHLEKLAQEGRIEEMPAQYRLRP